MRCRRVTRLLDAFREGELPEAPARAVRAHVEACSRCAEELRQRTRAAEALRGWEVAQASDALTNSVLLAWERARAAEPQEEPSLAQWIRTPRQEPAPARRRRVPVLAWAGACAACGLLAAVLLTRVAPRPMQTTPRPVAAPAPRVSPPTEMTKVSEAPEPGVQEQVKAVPTVPAWKQVPLVQTHRGGTHKRHRVYVKLRRTLPAPGPRLASAARDPQPAEPQPTQVAHTPAAEPVREPTHRLSTYVNRLIGQSLAARYLPPADRKGAEQPAAESGAAEPATA